MEGQLKIGKTLISQLGNKYKVNKLLGAGGQGEVYDVNMGRKRMALKWYYKTSATDKQRKILDNLIEKIQGGMAQHLPIDETTAVIESDVSVQEKPETEIFETGEIYFRNVYKQLLERL